MTGAAGTDSSTFKRAIMSSYRLVLAPLLFACILVGVGIGLDTIGLGISAGLAGALAVFVVVFAALTYVLLEVMTRVGY